MVAALFPALLLAGLWPGMVTAEDGPSSTPPPPPPSQGGNSTEEEPLALPTFTYAATDDDIKEAAYRFGASVRAEPDLQLELPPPPPSLGTQSNLGWNNAWILPTAPPPASEQVPGSPCPNPPGAQEELAPRVLPAL